MFKEEENTLEHSRNRMTNSKNRLRQLNSKDKNKEGKSLPYTNGSRRDASSGVYQRES